MFYFVAYTVCICQEGGMSCKVGIRIIFTCGFGPRDSYKRAPIILNSKAVVLGWITIYLSTSSSLMVILWHWWIVVAHQRLNGICLRLQKWHLQSIFLSTGNIGITFNFQGWRITSTIIRYFYHDNSVRGLLSFQ